MIFFFVNSFSKGKIYSPLLSIAANRSSFELKCNILAMDFGYFDVTELSIFLWISRVDKNVIGLPNNVKVGWTTFRGFLFSVVFSVSTLNLWLF